MYASRLSNQRTCQLCLNQSVNIRINRSKQSINKWIHLKTTKATCSTKLSSLCYNCLNSTASDYLTELLRIYKPTCQLHSCSDTSILCILNVCTHLLGQRLFSYAAPVVRNTLPYKIRSSNTISSLKSSLIFFSSPTDCVWGGGEGER